VKIVCHPKTVGHNQTTLRVWCAAGIGAFFCAPVNGADTANKRASAVRGMRMLFICFEGNASYKNIAHRAGLIERPYPDGQSRGARFLE